MAERVSLPGLSLCRERAVSHSGGQPRKSLKIKPPDFAYVIFCIARVLFSIPSRKPGHVITVCPHVETTVAVLTIIL